jgi:dethiobiotin synthetase
VSRIICITGTDTGVGKTVLTTLLLSFLRKQGVHALAMKPFCSGGKEDIDQIRAIQGDELPPGLLNPNYFRLPLAPYVAARESGQKISFMRAIHAVQKASMRCDCLLVEGAGGALTPITRRNSFADLTAQLSAEVIVVGSNKLGVLNHVLLTIEALRSRGVVKIKVVLMGQPDKNNAEISNAVTLQECLIKSGVFSLPHLGFFSNENKKNPADSKKIKKTLAQIAAPDTFTSVVRDVAKRSETKS